MPKKFHWDLIRAIAVIGAIVVIIFNSLIFTHIWNPIGGFIATDLIVFLIEIVLSSSIIIGWGILGWDVWEVRYSFLTFLSIGIILIVLFGNLAGIILIVAAIPIPFGS